MECGGDVKFIEKTVISKLIFSKISPDCIAIVFQMHVFVHSGFDFSAKEGKPFCAHFHRAHVDISFCVQL
ncbi:hypothetical protein T07_2568 [Trichinella nelsoni]|uniref:Uncharacterized protein n=1 Tax=Trichinella nelsoni TaxID=6336 RepID=A0A0V0S1L4_9BILA|nr:hypothetical protein T07_2568 [Trichinella nelsoni]